MLVTCPSCLMCFLIFWHIWHIFNASIDCFMLFQHICIGSTVVLQLLFLGHFLVSTGYSALIQFCHVFSWPWCTLFPEIHPSWISFLSIDKVKQSLVAVGWNAFPWWSHSESLDFHLLLGSPWKIQRISSFCPSWGMGLCHLVMGRPEAKHHLLKLKKYAPKFMVLYPSRKSKASCKSHFGR